MNSSKPYHCGSAHALNWFSQSHSTTLAALNHPSNDISFVIQTIDSADHILLLQARNKAYIRLYGRFIDERAKLKTIQ